MKQIFVCTVRSDKKEILIQYFSSGDYKDKKISNLKTGKLIYKNPSFKFKRDKKHVSGYQIIFSENTDIKEITLSLNSIENVYKMKINRKTIINTNNFIYRPRLILNIFSRKKHKENNNDNWIEASMPYVFEMV